MDEFRTYLQQEYLKRVAKNNSYSLRAFAKALHMNHATLSSMMSGKRKITPNALSKLTKALGLGPGQFHQFISGETGSSRPTQSYYYIQQDAFNAISDWYFDAILQLSLIKKIKLEPETISIALGISKLEAKIALETLERLELLKKDKSGRYKKTHQNSVNYLDADFTNAAMRKYQKRILEKSREALETLPRSERDHTSTTMAVQKKDLTKVKELIKKFRNDLDSYLQRDEAKFDEVYQLQVSFFPLTNLRQKNLTGTNLEKNKESKEKK